MQMNAHLHAILLFAGLDPAAFMTDMAVRYPDMDYGFNAADVINAARPGAGFRYVNICLWNGRIELTSMGGRDAGGTIDQMMISNNQTLSFAPPQGGQGAYVLLRDGPRELRHDRMINDLRQPVANCPEWLVDTSVLVQVMRNSLKAYAPVTYVDIDVTIANPLDVDELATA